MCRSRVCQNDTYYKRYWVEVANLNYNKKVSIHQQMSNGQWQDYTLQYDFTTSTGTEIWKVEFSYGGYAGIANPFGRQFVVKYEVNGQTYLDNNNNTNYTLPMVSPTVSSYAVILGKDINVKVASSEFYYAANNQIPTNLFVSVNLRSLAYSKEVKIVYTTNNWATTTVIPLSYDTQSQYSSSFPTYETWGIHLYEPNTVKQIQYSIVYKVNGAEYWDNNFGNNYTLIAK
jgi:hypothetical protein